MLWQKESNRNNAVYVNIFAPHKALYESQYSFLMFTKKPIPKKSDAIALKKRKEGNKLFGQREWYVAMELYNECLCYAEEGSEHISLAFANRSACFFNMKLYTECMADIESAKNAGYPEHLVPKLDQRKIDCMKLIEEGAQVTDDFGLKLSFDPDETFRCMANVLKIQREPNGDFCVIAKEDIEVGKTVAVEETVHNYLYVRHGLKCNYCLKGDTNLIPCKKCTVAMFCSEKCQDALHKYECGLKLHNENASEGSVMTILRSVLWAVNLFPNFDQLMGFVERVNASGPSDHPNTLSDDRSKYWTFLKAINTSRADYQDSMLTVFEIFKQLTSVAPYNTMFNAKKQRRFLTHLITHHMQATFRLSYQTQTSLDAGHEPAEFYSQTGLLSRFLKHCCGPNVLVTPHDGRSTFVSVRPIKKGDEVTVSHFSFFCEEKETRQQLIKEEHGYICKCARCENTFPQSRTQHHPMIESEYNNLKMCHMRMPSFNKEQVHEVLDKCIEYLKKYNDIRWSDRIAAVIRIYVDFLCYRFIGSVHRRDVLKMA